MVFLILRICINDKSKGKIRLILTILKDFLSVKVQAFKVPDHDKIVTKKSCSGHCQIFDEVSGGDQFCVE